MERLVEERKTRTEYRGKEKKENALKEIGIKEVRAGTHGNTTHDKIKDQRITKGTEGGRKS